MYGKGTIDMFISQRLEEEYHAKVEKWWICFLDLEIAFDSVPRKVLKWAMRMKGIQEVLIRSVMVRF